MHFEDSDIWPLVPHPGKGGVVSRSAGHQFQLRFPGPLGLQFPGRPAEGRLAGTEGARLSTQDVQPQKHMGKKSRGPAPALL